MRIRSLTVGGENVEWLQWSRFKRREKSVTMFVGIAVLLHLIFWVIWHFFIAPYPIALTLPVVLDLPENLLWVTDYLWPMANTVILAFNIWLIYRVYKKDIFASWLLIGGTLFLQLVVLSVTFYLASFISPL